MEKYLNIPIKRCEDCFCLDKKGRELVCKNWKLGDNKNFFRPLHLKYSCIESFKEKYNLTSENEEREKILIMLKTLNNDLIIKKVYCFISPFENFVYAITSDGIELRKEEIDSDDTIELIKKKIGVKPKDGFFDEKLKHGYEMKWVSHPLRILITKTFLENKN
jgi:hypothetical protein